MEIEIQDIKTNYEIVGQGDNVLVLHGWGGCIDSMRPVIDHLKRRFTVVSLDFPGHGKSGFPKDGWGVPEYTHYLYRFLKSINVEKTHIIAHSFGGRVSIMLSSIWPEMVGKMVLVDSGGIKPKRKLRYYIKVYTFKLIKFLLRLALFSNPSTYERILGKVRKRFGSSDYRQLPDNMRATFVKIVNLDLRCYLKNIKSPTLLVWGEKDQDTPVYMGKTMEKEIEESGLIILKGAGHFSYLDNSREFNIIIGNFLGGK